MGMATETLPKSYSPRDAEPAARARWDAARAFHADPRDTTERGKPPYCVLIPPPNVTAALHLGHALNNTLQDILVRFHRMNGFNTLWMPGTDHAGIATQAVVEKRLLQEGKRRTDFTRDEFIALVQEWKDEYEATITEQLKVMGCSCDFERQRFTMDDVCATAVREAFFRLFKAGLIYRGKRLVNWDPVSQTALADDEVDMEEVQGFMYFLRYPLVHPSTNPSDPRDCQEVTWGELARRGYPGADEQDEDANAWITVATTRPETYLGDSAVAVNPKDPRAASLRGLSVQLPLVGRVIPVIEDDYVVRPVAFGGDENDAKAAIATGFLKVTPAHDPNDAEIGKRHNLAVINMLAPDASISDKHGWPSEDVGDARMFIGLSREAAREKVVKEFDARGLLEGKKPYTHSVGHSYRSHVPIEPYLSDQWYMKVTDDRLVGEAQRSQADEQFEGERPPRAGGAASPHDGSLTFYPARYARTFQQWHAGLRDWCISRQLWWGHRIPVWAFQPTPHWEGESSTPEAIAVFTKSIQKWMADGRVAEYDRRLCDYSDPNQANQNEGLRYYCVRSELDLEVIRVFEQMGCRQDPDVLDTWFSSGLWPLSTMGWPGPERWKDQIPEGSALLDVFNPSSVLCTAREIITLWVSRMVMFNRFLTADDPDPSRRLRLPYKDVYIHAMIQDGHGQKMSKSLGNGVDPRDIIHTHGADAMRFTLAQLATATQDVRMPVDTMCPHADCNETFQPKEITSGGYRVAAPEQTCPKCGKGMVTVFGAASGQAKPSKEKPLARNTSSKFDLGRNFSNKLWNAVRFALANLEASNPQAVDASIQVLTLADKWILSRLHRTLHAVEDAIKSYQFNTYAEAMYDFVWRDFCDWYLEAIKPTVKSSPAQQQVLRTVLNAALRLLHPIMPLVTETLWPHVAASGPAGLDGVTLGDSDLLATAPWPDIRCSIDDRRAHDEFARLQTLVNAIRNLRGENRVNEKKRITLHAPMPVRELIERAGPVASALAGLGAVEPVDSKPAESVAFTFEGEALALAGLVEAVDRAAVRTRLSQEIESLRKRIAGHEGRLANEGYLAKAPVKLVEQTRAELASFASELAAKERELHALADGG
jgi:valyl-tRNA synthetase